MNRWILCFVLSSVVQARAGDWPQILGPHRNGQAENEKLASDWSTKKPQKVWSVKVGSGYAGPAVVGADVFVVHRVGGETILDCLSVSDGTKNWTARWPSYYAGGYNPDDGPRCVPIVDDGRIFLFTAAGDLHCVDQSTGAKRWSRALAKDFRAPDGYFGAGSTPIVIGGNLLVNIGGKAGASIVSLDPKSGTTNWKAIDDEASYASPIPWSANKDAAIFVTRMNAFGVSVLDGKELFRSPFGRRGTTVSGATPLEIKGLLFLTASYGIGAQLLDITTPSTPRKLWSNDSSLSSQYPTPIHFQGKLIGTHGREDGPAAELRCINLRSGIVIWSQPDFGMAHLILADGKLLALRTEGEFVLIDPSSSKYSELGRHKVGDAIARALPALAAGRIYVRSTDGTLDCWVLP